MAFKSNTSISRLLYYIIPNSISGFAYGWEVASMGGKDSKPVEGGMQS